VTWESSSGCSDILAGVLGFFAKRKENGVYDGYKVNRKRTWSEARRNSEEIYRLAMRVSRNSPMATWSALADSWIFCYVSVYAKVCRMMWWYQRLPCAARTLLPVRDYLQDTENKLGHFIKSTFCKRYVLVSVALACRKRVGASEIVIIVAVYSTDFGDGPRLIRHSCRVPSSRR
jgi:hypothetical protein